MYIGNTQEKSMQVDHSAEVSLERSSNWNGHTISSTQLTQKAKEVKDLVAKTPFFSPMYETVNLHSHHYSISSNAETMIIPT